LEAECPSTVRCRTVIIGLNFRVRPIEGDGAFDRCALRRRCGKRRRCRMDTGEILAAYACKTSLSKSAIHPAEHSMTAIT